MWLGFYVYNWYWKCTQTQARRQVPQLSKRRQNMDTYEGGPFWILPSPFHIKVYNALTFSKTKTIGSAQYGPR